MKARREAGLTGILFTKLVPGALFEGSDYVGLAVCVCIPILFFK